MNVYDFDKTIYKDDSTVDFFFYSIKHHPSILLNIPKIAFAALLWALGIIDKTGFKEIFYNFLEIIPNIDQTLEDFWDEHEYKIKTFYKNHQQPDDVVISASPEFLLTPIAKRLGIKHLLASRVNKFSGLYTGENCWGKEKVFRFYEEFGEAARIDEFYSDSLSDSPLAMISEKSFIVEDEKLTPWQEYTPKKNAFLSKEFLLFLIVGGINTINGVVFSWIYSLFLNPNLAFVVGYISSLFIAYLLNSKFIFPTPISFSRFLKFCISYIPNFIIQNISVFVIFNLLKFHELIAYIVAAIIGIPITFLAVKLFAFGKKIEK